jgi:hypothetical protein
MMRRLLSFVAGSAVFISALGMLAPVAAQRVQGKLAVEIVPMTAIYSTSIAVSPDGARLLVGGDQR